MRRPLHFWMPEPDQFPSGGNVYNANIVKALVELGHPVTQAADWVEHRPQDGLLIVDTLMLGQPALATAPAPKILLVHHLRSLEMTPSKDRVAQQQREKRQLAPFDALWGTSAFTAHYLRNTLACSQLVFQVPPAFDLEPGPPPEPRHGLRQVLVVANWIPRKGILDLLRAWFRRSWPTDVVLRLVGSTDLDRAYARRCWELIDQQRVDGGGSVEVMTHLSRSEMTAVYRSADLLLSAASVETFGMAIQEALAMGVPVLSVEGAYAARSIVPGENGEVYASVEEMVAGLYDLLEREGHWRGLRAGARRRREQWQRPWSTAGRELLSILTQWEEKKKT
ncbi:MAG: glycosyltransferase [Bacteroidota bacterium]